MAKPWADKPFELLLIPGTPGAPSCSNPGIMSIANEMANVHNMLLRGLNSIYLQAPKITLPNDIADLMLYTKAWAETVHVHHSHEEAILFPKLDALARETGEQESIMNSNIDQHHIFEPRMAEMVAHVQGIMDGKWTYDSAILLALIDGFAPILTQHLHDEIDTIIKLEKCNGDMAKKIMKETADEGIKDADPNLVIPLALGCVDKTYLGSANFPPVPFFVPMLNAYWFTRKHKGCWRFNPSDHWGNPRPLHFL